MDEEGPPGLPDEEPSPSARKTPPGRRLVGPVPIIVLMIVFAAAALLTLYAVWAFWPSEAGKAVGGVSPRKTVHVFFHRRTLSRESLFFIMVALTGSVGGMVHVIRSFAWYVGNRELRWSWVPFYLLKPVLGALMATLLYFIIRAGFFSPSASTSQTSPYGFAAVSALAGLFSDQAIVKLRKVAAELFVEPERGKDSVVATEPVVTTAAPTVVTPTEAVLTGTVNPNGQETTYQFEWGETTAYGNVAPPPPVSAGAGLAARPVSARVIGLVPGREYHYRLVASSATGEAQSPDQAFTTPMP